MKFISSVFIVIFYLSSADRKERQTNEIHRNFETRDQPHETKSKDQDEDSPQMRIHQRSHREISRSLSLTNPTEKEFYDHYTKRNEGQWVKLRELEEGQRIKICEEVYKRERVHERVAFYQAEPIWKELKVKLDIENIDDLATDLLRCSVEIIILSKVTMYPNHDVFYVAEGDSPTSFFTLRTTHNLPNDPLRIYGKIDNLNY